MGAFHHRKLSPEEGKGGSRNIGQEKRGGNSHDECNNTWGTGLQRTGKDQVKDLLPIRTLMRELYDLLWKPGKNRAPLQKPGWRFKKNSLCFSNSRRIREVE